MIRWRTGVMLILTSIVILTGAGAGTAAAKQLAAPKNVVVTATSSTSISVSFSTVPGAGSYTVYLYPATGKVLQAYPNASPTGTNLSALSKCTTYRISVQAISSSGTVLNSVQSGKIAVTTSCSDPALVPTFGTPAPTADGFTVQITNHDTDFSWSVTVTAGSATIDATGLVTVTGLDTDDQQTVTVTTTRSLFESGSASISGARSVAPDRWIGAGDFTVELWVKPTVNWSDSGRQELFALLPTSYNARLDIAYERTAWYVFDFNSVTPGNASPNTMAPPAVGSWTHIALTRQSNILRLYVAGQKVIESTASGDLSGLNQLLLGADPNTSWCLCNLATAMMSNVRVIDGTALYTGNSLTVPVSPLTAVAGTTFLLNNAIGQPAAGSVVLDGTTRYEQSINVVDSAPVVSSFDAYKLVSRSWTSSTVVTSDDSPFNVCGSNGLRASGSACQVGDRGPGGGTVFYVSATPFTSTGSVCATACRFLEVAPIGWASLSAVPENTNDYLQQTSRTDPMIDPSLIWWYGPSREPPAGITTGTEIGTGMANTLALKAATTPATTPSGQSRFAFDAALNYAGPNTSAGEWFLPSIGELNELCKFANGQTADLGVAVGCSPTISGANVPALGFVADVIYWSSSHPAMDMPYPYGGSAVGSLNQTPGYVLRSTLYAVSYLGYYSVYAEYVRPIRAF